MEKSRSETHQPTADLRCGIACPFSLSCLAGRPIEAHLYRCPHCGSIWYRSSTHSYRCDHDPQPVTGEQYVTWVCWDCTEEALAEEIDAKQEQTHG